MGLGPMFSALLRAARYARAAGMERSGNAMPKQQVTAIRAAQTFPARMALALLNRYVYDALCIKLMHVESQGG